MPEPLQTPEPPEPPERLRAVCDPAQFDFDTTAQLSPLEQPFGQDRAVRALQLALSIPGAGHHPFVLGEPGSSRHAIVRGLLEAHVRTRPAPPDWCYVNRFSDPNRPRALQLPPGQGARLHEAMQRFVAEIGKAIAAALEGHEYRSRLDAIQREFKQREEGSLQTLGDEASGQGVALLRTPQGLAFAPMRDGQPMASEAFEALPQEEREGFAKRIETLSERLRELLHEFPRLRREMHTRIGEATREALGLAAGHLVDELKTQFQSQPAVLDFLDEVRQDVIDSGARLHETPRGEEEEEDTPGLAGTLSLQRYQVNLLVAAQADGHAPVLAEDHPTFAKLVGRIDQVAHMGTLLTHFTLIRAGALHRANGGCLMLDAAKVLAEPMAWPGLKRALRTGQLVIESLPQAMGWASTRPLEPEPIPLAVKIVMFGERLHYYLLQSLDPEFGELFRVMADFEDEVPRGPAQVAAFARLVGVMARDQGLRALDRAAVARLVEEASREADDAGKLSTRTRAVATLLREADALAAAAGRAVIGREDVAQALTERTRRADRLRDTVLDAMRQRLLRIDTAGAHAGQVNGLAVAQAGEFAFAYPVRVTATARLGDGELVDIERESTLGGPLHSKGVMILAAFLGDRFAQDLPLSLSASLVFEQSYAPVEGDSASLAELCALLSALANVPARQAVAVTGSVDQFGQVQAVGGVNEKVEGFFDLCRERGLTGEQGVVIPRANLAQLMLREDVVAAAAQGQFHVWAVDDVDQAIELLTGVCAGVPNAKGEVPAGSVNHLAATRLAQLSLLRQAWSSAPVRRAGRTRRARQRPRQRPRGR